MKLDKIGKFLSAILVRTDVLLRETESEGPLLCSFSIRCSLSNVDYSFFVFRLFFISITKVIYWHDTNTCKGKVPADQLPFYIMLKHVISRFH